MSFVRTDIAIRVGGSKILFEVKTAPYVTLTVDSDGGSVSVDLDGDALQHLAAALKALT